MSEAAETRVVNGATHVWVKCGRCSGTGHYGGPVQGGKCFGCLDANGHPVGGEWIPEKTAKTRAAAAKRRAATRKAKEAKRFAEFSARTDAAIAKLVAVGFTKAGEIMATSSDPRESGLAQEAIFRVRDYGWDAAESYTLWREAQVT